MTTKYEGKSTPEILEDVQETVTTLARHLTDGMDQVEQRLAEAGMIPTADCPRCHGTGVVSIRYADEAHAEPEPHTRQCGHDDYHDAHEWADHPHIWCPGIDYYAEPAAGARQDGVRS